MKAKTNPLIALRNIIQHNSSRATPLSKSNGTMNKRGDSLEYFIKDMFCPEAQSYPYADMKEIVYVKSLSWTGDSSHFPDMIVRNGVGVETKEIEGDVHGAVALNSSYPKDFIDPSTQNIPPQDLDPKRPEKKTMHEDTKNWDRKPIIYAVGNIKKNDPNKQIISLWLAYGDTMVPCNAYYKQLIQKFRDAIKSLNANVTLQSNSKELARAKGIDRLKRTNLRARGMYELMHPAKIFANYLQDIKVPANKSQIYLIMLESDYQQIKHDMGQEWNALHQEFEQYIAQNKLIEKQINIPNPNYNPKSKDIRKELPARLFIAFTD